MKDGRTHLAHTAEHAVDLDTGAIVGVTVQDASAGDTTTLVDTLVTAAEQVEAVGAPGIAEVVADKGYHSNETMVGFAAIGVRSYVSEPDRGRRTGRARRRRGTRCMPTGGGSAARAGNGCCGSGASYWNGPTRISTRPAGCAASICAGIPTS